MTQITTFTVLPALLGGRKVKLACTTLFMQNMQISPRLDIAQSPTLTCRTMLLVLLTEACSMSCRSLPAAITDRQPRQARLRYIQVSHWAAAHVQLGT
jgi:hypothetical protein